MTDAQKGLMAAILSPVFLGMAPVLGKYALVGGADPFTVAAIRTVMVAIILWLVYLAVWRQYVYIYPAGLLACVAIGFTNGIGSLFYYSGLDRLDASIAQILNATYVIWVVILTRISGAKVGLLTGTRIAVSLFGVLLIAGGLTGQATWLGVGLMIGNALLFGGTVVMSQRILYEMPAQTVTLYVMTTMAGVVLIARLIVSQSIEPLGGDAIQAILALAVTTALSRLTLFAGVKGVGSIRTTLMAVGEGAVAVTLAFIFLGDTLTVVQWVGVAALAISLFMPTDIDETDLENTPTAGRASLPNVAGVRFGRMSAANKLSTQEMERLMGLMVEPLDKLNTMEMKELKFLIGEDGIEAIRELEEPPEGNQK